MYEEHIVTKTLNVLATLIMDFSTFGTVGGKFQLLMNDPAKDILLQQPKQYLSEERMSVLAKMLTTHFHLLSLL